MSTASSLNSTIDVQPQNSSAAKAKKTRRRHKNSRHGCLPCKKRKIKCDERLVPYCQNCEKMGLTCSYLSLTPEQIAEIKLSHQMRDAEDQTNATSSISNSTHHIKRTQINLSSRSGVSSNSVAPTGTSVSTEGSSYWSNNNNNNNNPNSLLESSSSYGSVFRSESTTSLEQIPYSYLNGSSQTSDTYKSSNLSASPMPNYDSVEMIGPSSRYVGISIPVYGAEQTYVKQMKDLTGMIANGSFISQTIRSEQFSQYLVGYYTKLFFNRVSIFFPFSPLAVNAFLLFSADYYRSVSLRQEDLKLFNHDKINLFLSELSDEKLSTSLKLSREKIVSFKRLSYAEFESVTCATIVLSWTPIYEEYNLSKYLAFTSGIFAMAMAGNPSEELRASQDKRTNSSFLASSLIYSFKTLYFNNYDPSFLKEIYQKLLLFGEIAKITNNPDADELLVKRYNLLADFLREYSDYLINFKKLSGCLTHPIELLLKLSIKFVPILPPDLCNLKYLNEADFVLRLFYITVGESLWAIMPEVTFITLSDFLGNLRLLIQEFAKSEVMAQISRTHVGKYGEFSAYLIRVFTFFRKRRNLLYKNMMFADTFAGLGENISRQLLEEFVGRSKKLQEAKETQMMSFEHQIIRFENYPHREHHIHKEPESSPIQDSIKSSSAMLVSPGTTFFDGPILEVDYTTKVNISLGKLEIESAIEEPVSVERPFKKLIVGTTLTPNGLLVDDFDPDDHINPEYEAKAAMHDGHTKEVAESCFLLRKMIIDYDLEKNSSYFSPS